MKITRILYFFIFVLHIYTLKAEDLLSIPINENIQLNAGINLNEKRGNLVIKGQTLEVGPLTIVDGEVTIGQNGFSLAGDGTLFGLAVKISAKEVLDKNGKEVSKEELSALAKAKRISLDNLILSVQLIEPLTFTLVNDKKVIIEKLNVEVGKGKPLKVTSTVNVFGQIADVYFKINNQKVDIEASLKNPLSLKDIIPSLTGSVSTIVLSDVTLSLINVLNFGANKAAIDTVPKIKMSTTVKAEKTIYPFADSGIPGITQIGFNNFSLNFERSGQVINMQLNGQASIFNKLLDASLRFIQKETTNFVTVLEINAQTYAHISQLITQLKGSIFDNITISNLKLLVASKDFDEEIVIRKEKKKIQYKAGIALICTTQLSGALAPVAKLAHQPESASVILTGYLAAQVLDSSFKIDLPFTIPVQGNAISIDTVSVEITGKPLPTLSLVTGLNFKVPKRGEPLHFKARISVNPTDALIAGTLLGVWTNPFDLHGFTLANVALQIGINYASLAAGVPISMLGLAATMGLGKRTLSFASNITLIHPEDFVLTASLDKVTIQDFAELVTQVVKKSIDTRSIPDISFERLRFYMAPKTTKIGELEFKQGFGGSGGLNVSLFKAFVDFSYMQDEGIIFEGYATQFKLGELLVTGAGPDRVYGTADDGPYVRLDLTKSKRMLFLSGLVVLDPVFKSQTEIDFEGTNISFAFDTFIKNLFNAHIIGKASLQNPQVYFFLDFSSEFAAFLQGEVNKALTDFQKKATEDLTNAQNKVSELNKNISDLDAQINNKTQKINDLKKIIDQKTLEAQQKVSQAAAVVRDKQTDLDRAKKSVQGSIDDAKREVESKKRDLDPLQQKVNEFQRKWDSLSDIEKSIRWVDVGIPLGSTKAALGVAQGSLQVAQDFLDKVVKGAANDVAIATAQTALNAAQSTLEGVKKASFDPTSAKEATQITQLGTEIGGLNVARASVLAARESANHILEGLKKASYYAIGEGGKIIVKSLLDIIQITHVKAEASASDLLKGILPKFTLEMVIFGQKKSLTDLQLRFNDKKATEESFKNIVQQVVKFVTG